MKAIEDLDQGTLRRIDWQELFPGVLIFRALGQAFRILPILGGAMMVFLASVLGVSGGAISPRYLSPEPLPFTCFTTGIGHPSTIDMELMVDSSLAFRESIPESNSATKDSREAQGARNVLEHHEGHTSPLLLCTEELPCMPLGIIGRFMRRHSISEVNGTPLSVQFGSLRQESQSSPLLDQACLVGFSAVFLFFAIFLSRKGAVRLATTERSPIAETWRFATKRYPSVLLALFIPMLGVFLSGAVVDWLSCGSRIFCAMSPVIMLASFVNVACRLGMLIGAPMVIAAVAVDRCDGFDAFSRTFSYLFQRPFHVVFYLFLLEAFGWLGYYVTSVFVSLMNGVMTELVHVNLTTLDMRLPWVRLCWGFFRSIPAGFLVSYYILASTALYYILRRCVDGVAYDKVAMRRDLDVRRLRPILADSEGAPVIGDSPSDTLPRATTPFESVDSEGSATPTESSPFEESGNTTKP